MNIATHTNQNAAIAAARQIAQEWLRDGLPGSTGTADYMDGGKYWRVHYRLTDGGSEITVSAVRP